MNLFSEPSTALLGISPREMKTYFYAEICTQRFVAALFVVTQNRKLPKCPSVHEWLNKPWSIYGEASVQFSSFQSLSRVRLFETPWITARQASLSITNSQSLPKLMSIESVMPSSHLILCHPLHLLLPIPPIITVFSNESTLCMRWPKY